MRAADLQRCGSFFQIKPIIHDSFRIAYAPPPRLRERGWIEEARRDIQGADTISSLRPLVTAEDEKIDAASNHVNGETPIPCVASTTKIRLRSRHSRPNAARSCRKPVANWT